MNRVTLQVITGDPYSFWGGRLICNTKGNLCDLRNNHRFIVSYYQKQFPKYSFQTVSCLSNLFLISVSISFCGIKHSSLLDENFKHRKKSGWLCAFLPRLFVHWIAREAAGQYFTSYNLNDLKQFWELLHISCYCTWFVLNLPVVPCISLSCRCKNIFARW